ncbi:MAG: DEAD/DEAH box helicase [Candidatus Sericytochromatia bacterium]|nr:DEAD/DEAH box helicase [Candidatus Sericytochromatia bacterium]
MPQRPTPSARARKTPADSVAPAATTPPAPRRPRKALASAAEPAPAPKKRGVPVEPPAPQPPLAETLPSAAPRKPAAKRAKPTATGTLIDAFAAQQRFPLDDFQREAMEALLAGRSVLVSAPTGSGKTIVAEFAIFLARSQGRRCIYTTPLKALSNQKYRDLRRDLGDDVGLVTGDVVLQPNAPVLIMTTEILRNMLQVDPSQVEDVSHVILDEAHYIGADGRGTVWEETIVFLGKNTRIVALSATIPNADELAAWVSDVHQPMDVILHEERPVPLEPYMCLDKVEPLFDQRGRLRARAFVRDGWVESPASSHVAHELSEKGMLPAIFFVFSRLGCEKEAIATIRGGNDLTTPEEKARIRAAVDAAIAQTPGMLTSNATKGWLERLPSGVAPHHAGLLPPLKLLIEELFQANLLKVVFATETLAAGINMPARTVVITSLSKRTDDGHRMLTVGEFAQMTGRAGRRGMDTVGYGVVLGSHRYGAPEVAALFQGRAEPLRSRFTLNYNMVINLVHQYDEAQARRIVEQCFSQFQNNATVAEMQTRRIPLRARLDATDGACPREAEFARKDRILAYVGEKRRAEEAAQTLRDLEKNLRGQNEKEAQRTVLAAPFDSVIVVKRPGLPNSELALMLNKYRTKRGVQFTALLGNGQLVRLAAKDLVLSTGATVRGVPRGWRDAGEALSYMQTKRVQWEPAWWSQWLEEAGVDPALVLPAEQTSPALQRARSAFRETEEALQAQPCHTCRHLPTCKATEVDLGKTRKLLTALDDQIETIRTRFWNQFTTLRTVLEQADFLRGRDLLPRGVALANLRTANELVASESLAAGLLESLAPDELAAVTSAIVAEPVRGRMAWRPIRPSPKVVQVAEDVIDIAQRLYRIQDRFPEVELPITVVTDYCGMVQAWAGEAQWAHVTEMAGIDEGQLVRHLRQVIDMLSQFKDVPGMSPGFVERVQSAVALIDRDIVREVF